jgi:pyoverdine/dityrosine biosynthesis protein Dit1
MLHKVRQAAAGVTPGLFEKRLTAQVAIAGVTYSDMITLLELYGAEYQDDLKEMVDAMSATQLDMLMLDCILVKNVAVKSYNEPRTPAVLLAAATHYGVDIDELHSAYPGDVLATVDKEA